MGDGLARIFTSFDFNQCPLGLLFLNSGNQVLHQYLTAIDVVSRKGFFIYCIRMEHGGILFINSLSS